MKTGRIILIVVILLATGLGLWFFVFSPSARSTGAGNGDNNNDGIPDGDQVITNSNQTHYNQQTEQTEGALNTRIPAAKIIAIRPNYIRKIGVHTPPLIDDSKIWLEVEYKNPPQQIIDDLLTTFGEQALIKNKIDSRTLTTVLIKNAPGYNTNVVEDGNLSRGDSVLDIAVSNGKAFLLMEKNYIDSGQTESIQGQSYPVTKFNRQPGNEAYITENLSNYFI